MFTTFHTAQATGTDWQDIGRRLRQQLPQPCQGGLGLLWCTPALDEDSNSLALMLRSATKIPAWSSITADGIMGLPSGQKSAAVLILPYTSPDFSCDIKVPAAEPGIMLFQHHGQDGAAAYHRLNSTSDFILGAHFCTADSSPQTNQIHFGPVVAVASGVTQSCLPVGPTHSITRARGKEILTIDDAPAQQILRREIGGNMFQAPSDWRDRIFIGLPERGHDRDDYRTVNIAALETGGGIVTADAVETGRRVLFTARSAAGAAHDLRQMLRTTLARCPNPRAALYYTTTNRLELFLDESGELGQLRAALDPKIPLISLQATAIVSGRRIHHDAGLLVLFGS